MEPAQQDSSLVSPAKAAELLQLSTRTLTRYRSEGYGPPYKRLGKRKVRYALTDLLAYLHQGAAA